MDYSTLVVFLLTVVTVVLAVLAVVIGVVGLHTHGGMQEAIANSQKATNQMKELAARYRNTIQGAQGMWIEYGEFEAEIDMDARSGEISIDLSKTHGDQYIVLFSTSESVNPWNYTLIEPAPKRFRMLIANTAGAYTSDGSGRESVRGYWVAIGQDPSL